MGSNAAAGGLTSSTTLIYLHQNNLNGVSIADWVRNMTLSTNSVGGRIRASLLSTPTTFIDYTVTGSGSALALQGGYYYAVPVTYVAGSTVPGLEYIIISFVYAGNSGFSGYSGRSGFSGYSGISGFSGYSGYGQSGFSGYSGYGTSGFSGYSGYGASGFSGYSGYNYICVIS